MIFSLGCEVTVSAYTTVEADSLEEALKLAEDREVVIGGICSGTDEREQWVIDEADGSPLNIAEI
jgi:hypothetical protein